MIRNYNEAEALKKCLVAVQQQLTKASIEIVVLDNESTDDSVAVAQSFGARVFTLPKLEFTFGRALNQGISYCTGEFILLLSSHVLLLTAHFIEDFLCYLEDPKVGGMRFCICSAPNMILDDVKPRRLSFADIKNDDGKQAILKHWSEFIVANCSVIRKSCWELQPFDEDLIASEEKLWSVEVLKKGYDILYQAPCYYLYFKHRTPAQQSKKNRIEAVVLHQVGGMPKPSLLRIISNGFRKLAGGTRKSIADSYRQVKDDLQVRREIHKTKTHP